MLKANADDLASRILRLEQQLAAYEQLHAGELAELWGVLNECKRLIAGEAPDRYEQSGEASDRWSTDPGNASAAPVSARPPSQQGVEEQALRRPSMTDEHVPEKQVGPDQPEGVDETPETESFPESRLKISRRQFLVGAGSGLVVGAAGAAGVFTLARPPAAPEAPAKPVAPQPAPAQPAAAPALVVSRKQIVTLNVNGQDYALAVEPQTTLLEALKRDLGLTGVKLGCNGSMCSACTVLVDGVAMNSCSLLAIREGGKKITTIEGLEQDGKLHPVQVAFWENQGYQCGFCTPGQILATVELLTKTKNPTEEQIRAHMSGHMCKCSAYPNIVKSVQAAAKAMA